MPVLIYDPENDFYDVLEIADSATSEEIKKAYRKLAAKWHPDTCHEVDAEERFKLIGLAYETLRDPNDRFIYDQIREESKVEPPPIIRLNCSAIDFGDVAFGEDFPERRVEFYNDGGEGVISTIPEEGVFWKVEGSEAEGDALGEFVFSLTIDETTDPGSYREYVQIQIDNESGISAVRILLTVSIEPPLYDFEPDLGKIGAPYATPIPYYVGSRLTSRRLKKSHLVFAALVAVIAVAGINDAVNSGASANQPSSSQDPQDVSPSPQMDLTVPPIDLAAYHRPIEPFKVITVVSPRVQNYLPIYSKPSSSSRLIKKVIANVPVTLLCVVPGETLKKSYAIPLDEVSQYSSHLWYKTQNPTGYISRLALFASGTLTGVDDIHLVDCDTGIRYTSFGDVNGANVYSRPDADTPVLQVLPRFNYLQPPNIQDERVLVIPVCKSPNQTAYKLGNYMYRLKQPEGWVTLGVFSPNSLLDEVPNC